MNTNCAGPQPAEYSKSATRINTVAKFRSLSALTIKNTSFWEATPCSLVYNVSEEPASIFLYPDDGSSRFPPKCW
jgi:hypothetical protein